MRAQIFHWSSIIVTYSSHMKKTEDFDFDTFFETGQGQESFLIDSNAFLSYTSCIINRDSVFEWEEKSYGTYC
jgi:hypothetical protein